MTTASQTGATPATTSNQLGIDVVAARLTAATEQLASIEHERAVGELAWREARSLIAQTGERTLAEINQRVPAPVSAGDVETDFAQLQAVRARWSARVSQAATRMRKQLRAELEQHVRELQRMVPAPESDNAPSPEATRERERRRAV
ncbi:MAG: hypothetical protein H0W83_03570, partial [Planctomycetes bacterium]|nr:hypothetical protein [Planctomycetota bacterium]